MPTDDLRKMAEEAAKGALKYPGLGPLYPDEQGWCDRVADDIEQVARKHARVAHSECDGVLDEAREHAKKLERRVAELEVALRDMEIAPVRAERRSHEPARTQERERARAK